MKYCITLLEVFKSKLKSEFFGNQKEDVSQDIINLSVSFHNDDAQMSPFFFSTGQVLRGLVCLLMLISVKTKEFSTFHQTLYSICLNGKVAKGEDNQIIAWDSTGNDTIMFTLRCDLLILFMGEAIWHFDLLL